MEFAITRGKQKQAQKVVLYGPEGIGKSTFAAQFPDPLFLDTEGSTKALDVARLPRPTSWPMLGQELNFVKESRPCRTLIIDTIDWAEQLCIEFICSKHGKQGIEDFGYGNGYVYAKEELGKLLNRLEELIERNIHVVLTAHAQIRKFEQPDEMGAYDRYELKLGKKTGSQTSPLVKEWADMVLFANYKTQSVAVDKKGQKHKAQGGRRVMYTAHHPCWDAKNRHGLAEELPFEYGAIAHCIADFGSSLQQTPQALDPAPAPAKPPELQTTVPAASQESSGKLQMPMEPTAQTQQPASTQEQQAPAAEQPPKPPEQTQPEPVHEPPKTEHQEAIPKQPMDPEVPKAESSQSSPVLDEHEEALKQLFDLMERTGVDRNMLQCAVKKYYPQDTPIERYTTEFLKWLPTQWDAVNDAIMKQLEEDIPF